MTKDNRILISGASGNIGSAIALKLAASGHNLLLHYHRQRNKAERLKIEIEQLGANAELLQFDLCQETQVSQALREATRKSTISHFVHAAGVVDFSPLGLMKIEAIQKVLRTNLEGFFYVSKRVLKSMIHQRQGGIIAIGSIASKKGFPGQSCYAAAKAGLEGAVHSLASELGPFGIRVNLVAPGLIDTPFSAPIAEHALKDTPLKRQGTPTEVAELVAFLCSEQASFISSAVIPISGGIAS